MTGKLFYFFAWNLGYPALDRTWKDLGFLAAVPEKLSEQSVHAPYWIYCNFTYLIRNNAWTTYLVPVTVTHQFTNLDEYIVLGPDLQNILRFIVRSTDDNDLQRA